MLNYYYFCKKKKNKNHTLKKESMILTFSQKSNIRHLQTDYMLELHKPISVPYLEFQLFQIQLQKFL